MSSVWPLCPDEVQRIAFLGHDITIHQLAVPAFKLVAERASLTAYGAAFEAGEIGPTPTGAYNCRNRRPYPEKPVTWDRHSEHAHAIAADIDYDSNPLRTDGVLITNFDRFGYDDGCDWLDCWLEPPKGLPVLFRWGGGWTTDARQAAMNLRHNGERIRSGVVDGMHFELSLTPAEVRAYDWTKAIEEATTMRREIEELVKDASKVRRATTFVDVLTEELLPGKDDATPTGAAKRAAKVILEAEKVRNG